MTSIFGNFDNMRGDRDSGAFLARGVMAPGPLPQQLQRAAGQGAALKLSAAILGAVVWKSSPLLGAAVGFFGLPMVLESFARRDSDAAERWRRDNIRY